MRIYIDVCCFNRPFDDQSQLVVRLETEAKLAVQESILQGIHTLVWSAVMDLENGRNPDSKRQEAITAWIPLAEINLGLTNEIEAAAELLSKSGLKAMDALHIASAITAEADVFLTTDKGILRKGANQKELRVFNPIDFVRDWRGKDED